MQTLNNLKRTFTVTREDLIYIENYQKVYKRVLRKVKNKKMIGTFLKSTERMKAMWRLINREIGKVPENEEKLELRIGNKLISNPTEPTDKVSTVEELVKQKSNVSVCNLKIKQCPNSIFIYPVTEEVISLTKSLKEKPTAGDDDMPENVVTQCMQLTKEQCG